MFTLRIYNTYFIKMTQLHEDILERGHYITNSAAQLKAIRKIV